MGCHISKQSSVSNPAAAAAAADCSILSQADDSIHVLLSHDQKRSKRHGLAPRGYIPRAPHPLLVNRITAVELEDGNDTHATTDEAEEDDHNHSPIRRKMRALTKTTQSEPSCPASEAERVLWHVQNHCDTVDVRDIAVASRFRSAE